MSINLTPTRGNYTDLKPFRYWCHKILPLTYDDSLSYYELLCKLVDYLNKTMEDVETLHDDMDGLYTAYEQLQDYVNHYFDSLDVTTEINNKLDKMARTGELSALIQPFVTENVTLWLETNITQETGYVIDKSLTIEDAAADAEATGDEINGTRQAITTLKDGLDYVRYSLPPQVTTDQLDVIDKNGNILTSIDWQGYIKGKGFDSQFQTYQKKLYTAVPYSLAIADENDNIAFGIVNGYGVINQRLNGKKLSILGDSISTFDGYIPSGYLTYYPEGNITKVENTWWWKLCNELGLTLLKNASWSGSGVTGNTASGAVVGCSDERIADLKDGNTKPDIIICYISTNDWKAGKSIGSFTPQSDIPSDGNITDISNGYALMLYKLRTTYPAAQIYCVTSLEGRTTEGDTSYPIVNSDGKTIHEVNHAITEVAHIFGCKVIDLITSGIHYWNVNGYTVDGMTHPNINGAEIIKEVIKMELINTFHNM